MEGPGELPTDGLVEENASAYYCKLLQLIQCSCCSLPLRAPVQLPCGDTICRSCIPQTHSRNNITYPGTEGRDLGFHCPSLCLQVIETLSDSTDYVPEHCLADCGLDITLGKVVDLFGKRVNTCLAEVLPTTDVPVRLRIYASGTDPAEPEREMLLKGGRLAGIYSVAEKGCIPSTSNIEFIFDKCDRKRLDDLDLQVLEGVKMDILKELDCQICYALMVDPYTTVCGHTFCRMCVTRMLDRSSLCPACRRKIPMILPTDPGNEVLNSLSSTLFPNQVTARLDGFSGKADLSTDGELPLFVCTVSFPHMPTYLHVFEPRYRRMILRVIENGTRRFGSVTVNRHGELGQLGQLGQVLEGCSFGQYGTLLEIDRLESLPGGRTLIRATGRYRFKVISGSEYDGCYVSRVERLDDIRIADEEILEAAETSASSGDTNASHLDIASTQEIFQLCYEFVKRCRAKRASWLNERIISAYGEPPTDPAIFPYWLGSVLPISSQEKYKLLSITSVRGRLKICAGWAEQTERDKQLLRSGRKTAFHISALLPFLFMFCIWFLPTLFLALLNLAGISTSGELITNSSSPWTVSFSVFPLGLSIQYRSDSVSSPSNTNHVPKPSGFAYSSFDFSQYFSRNLILGGIAVVCVTRVLRRFIEVLYQHQHTALQEPGGVEASTTPISPGVDDNANDLIREQNYTEAGEEENQTPVIDISAELDE